MLVSLVSLVVGRPTAEPAKTYSASTALAQKLTLCSTLSTRRLGVG